MASAVGQVLGQLLRGVESFYWGVMVLVDASEQTGETPHPELISWSLRQERAAGSLCAAMHPAIAEIVGPRFLQLLGIGAPPQVLILADARELDLRQWIIKRAETPPDQFGAGEDPRNFSRIKVYRRLRATGGHRDW